MGRHDIALGACANLESDIVGVNDNFGLPVLLGYPCDGSNEHFIIISLAPWFMFSEFVNGTCWQNDFAVHICGTQHLWQGIYVEVDAGIHSYHAHLPCRLLDGSGGGWQRIELET